MNFFSSCRDIFPPAVDSPSVFPFISIHTVNHAFLSLLSAFLENHHFPAQEINEAEGVELISGDHVAEIRPHTNHLDHLTIEIALRGLALGDVGSERFLLLHRLNAAARHGHPWTIYIDGDDMLVIGAVFRISDLDSTSLQSRLLDGFDRAKALDSMWKTSGTSPDETIPLDAEAFLRPDPTQLA